MRPPFFSEGTAAGRAVSKRIHSTEEAFDSAVSYPKHWVPPVRARLRNSTSKWPLWTQQNPGVKPRETTDKFRRHELTACAKIADLQPSIPSLNKSIAVSNSFPEHSEGSRHEPEQIPETVRSLLHRIGDLEVLKTQLKQAHQRLAELNPATDIKATQTDPETAL